MSSPDAVLKLFPLNVQGQAQIWAKTQRESLRRAERENPTVPGLWAALELCLLHCFAIRLVCQLNRDRNAMCQTCCAQELLCLLEF